MDEQKHWKNNLSVKARLKRKLILNKKRNRFSSSSESEKAPNHANNGIHSTTKKEVHGTALSNNSKDQVTSFVSHNISTATIGQPLQSGKHITGENHHVSTGEPEIHSTTHLKDLEGRGVCSAIAMKRSFPWDNRGGVLVSALNSSSPNLTSYGLLTNHLRSLSKIHIPLPRPSIDINSPDILTRRAAMYQDYMEQIPIPSRRASVIPFTSWIGLGKSIKKLYRQPLHYLTNVILKQWDQSRIGNEDEYRRLDDIIHPCKAEATIWLMEQIHRQTSSHFHIANLWKVDPMYNGFVDSIFPTIQHTS
ncbi:uncharacterized protein [Cicer arietinum]|nr:uncharacterized protein LOC101512373 isoform X2 [Cicer arietinum]